MVESVDGLIIEEIYRSIDPILTLPGTFTMRYNLPISFVDKYNLEDEQDLFFLISKMK